LFQLIFLIFTPLKHFKVKVSNLFDATGLRPQLAAALCVMILQSIQMYTALGRDDLRFRERLLQVLGQEKGEQIENMLETVKYALNDPTLKEFLQIYTDPQIEFLAN
jgi:hypothetical protein